MGVGFVFAKGAFALGSCGCSKPNRPTNPGPGLAGSNTCSIWWWAWTPAPSPPGAASRCWSGCGRLVTGESRRRGWMIASVCCPQIHALDAELVGVLAEFTTRSGMAGSGWRSFSHYLSVRTNFAPWRGTSGVDRAVDGCRPCRRGPRRAGVDGVLASAARVVTADNEGEGPRRRAGLHPRQAQRVLAAYRSLRPTTNDNANDGGGDGSVAG